MKKMKPFNIWLLGLGVLSFSIIFETSSGLNWNYDGWQQNNSNFGSQQPGTTRQSDDLAPLPPSFNDYEPSHQLHYSVDPEFGNLQPVPDPTVETQVPRWYNTFPLEVPQPTQLLGNTVNYLNIAAGGNSEGSSSQQRSHYTTDSQNIQPRTTRQSDDLAPLPPSFNDYEPSHQLHYSVDPGFGNLQLVPDPTVEPQVQRWYNTFPVAAPQPTQLLGNTVNYLNIAAGGNSEGSSSQQRGDYTTGEHFVQYTNIPALHEYPSTNIPAHVDYEALLAHYNENNEASFEEQQTDRTSGEHFEGQTNIRVGSNSQDQHTQELEENQQQPEPQRRRRRRNRQQQQQVQEEEEQLQQAYYSGVGTQALGGYSIPEHSQYGNTPNIDFGQSSVHQASLESRDFYSETPANVLRGSGSTSAHYGNQEHNNVMENLPAFPDHSFFPAHQYDDIEAPEFQNMQPETHQQQDASEGGPGCQIKLETLSNRHGLITDRNIEKILYPNDQGIIFVPEGDEIQINCLPNAVGDRSVIKNILTNHKSTTTKHTVFCEGGQLIYRRNPYDITNFECSLEPVPQLIKSIVPCGSGIDDKKLENYQIIIPLKSTFKVLAHLCVDESDPTNKDVVYVKTEFDGKTKWQERHTSRDESFISANNSPLMDEQLKLMYNGVTQRASLRDQLGRKDNAVSPQYNILTQENDRKYFILPGNLIGRFGFVLRMEKAASRFWANSKPMWAHVKTNWRKVEMAISILARSKTEPMTVYSGYHGILSHRHLSKIPTDLYLGKLPDSDRPYQAIPELFWKIVTLKEPGPGVTCCIAVVVQNTPYPLKPYACSPVQQRVDWFDQYNFTQNTEDGVVYACACQNLYPEITNRLPGSFRAFLPYYLLLTE